MENFDLSKIPKVDRELMEINQRQVIENLNEIRRLQEIANNKSDPKAAASARKRLTNATRVLADVVESPEFFANYQSSKGIKYVSEGYYGYSKNFLESLQLDPKGLTGGKSTLHHADSLKQLINAIYHPDPNVRYSVIKGLREYKKGDIGTHIQNLIDTEAKGGHLLFHADPKTGKADYKNKASTVKPIDLETPVEERIALGSESIRKQGEITAAAQQSEIVQGRNASMLADIAETPGGQQLLDKYGNPLDPKNPLRTPETIKEFKNLNVQYTPVLETVGGSIKLKRANFKAGGMGALAGLITNPEAMGMLSAGNITGALQSAGVEMAAGEGISLGLQGLASKAPAALGAVAPVLQSAGTVSTAAAIPEVIARVGTKGKKGASEVLAETPGAAVAASLGPVSPTLGGSAANAPVDEERNKKRLELEAKAKAARQRGGRFKLFGGAITLPEFGLSEMLEIN